MWIEISGALLIIAIAGHIIYHSLKPKSSENSRYASSSSKKKSNLKV